MARRNPDTLVAEVKVLAPAFTKPGLRNALLLILGWLATRGRHAVTQSLVELGIVGRVHHERLHRFFSRGTWSVDHLGRLLFERLLALHRGDHPITFAIDDTLVSHRGPQIFGIASHLDAVRSTRFRRVFSFGHVWVVLAVCVRLPFSERTWALPILFRLYRLQKTCKQGSGPFKKKTELAHEMLQIASQWATGRDVRVTADSAYANATVLADLPEHVTFVGAMRDDAALNSLPDATSSGPGRRRVRGERLPTPKALVKSPRQRWQRLTATIYGREVELEIKLFDAQWYRAAGVRPLRVVLVRVLKGDLPVRVFFSTDPKASAEAIVTTYAARWGIELAFRDMKQHLGFGDSEARCSTAVQRVAPLAGYLYTLLAIWFATLTAKQRRRAVVVRPWYRSKRGYSFEDILRAYLATGRAREGIVGSARSELIDAADIVAFGVAWMEEHFAGRTTQAAP